MTSYPVADRNWHHMTSGGRRSCKHITDVSFSSTKMTTRVARLNCNTGQSSSLETDFFPAAGAVDEGRGRQADIQAASCLLTVPWES